MEIGKLYKTVSTKCKCGKNLQLRDIDGEQELYCINCDEIYSEVYKDKKRNKKRSSLDNHRKNSRDNYDY